MNDELDFSRAWTLHKPDGLDQLCLGQLRLGMTREEVAAVAAPYGPVERVEDHATLSAGMAAGFEDLAKFGFAPEEIADAKAAWEAGADTTADLIIEDRGLGAPSLDYVGGRLSRVATDHHCTQLTLLGRPVYEWDGLELLAALESMETGEPLREGDTVLFPRLCVTAMGFYGDRNDGTTGLLDDPDDPRIRHLILEAYKPVIGAPAPISVTFRSPSPAT
ncbi:hypothetical protein [Fulvimarina sp. MAC8]|uniref:hypothetical protein n=1 Tax=Fulvimarina sp. MAC8 TaxID=3162874 RepID=UPI0032F080B1